jgi:hypothetical protein
MRSTWKPLRTKLSATEELTTDCTDNTDKEFGWTRLPPHAAASAIFLSVSSVKSVVESIPTSTKKKADVVEHPQALDHVGLIVKGRPAFAGITFKRSGNDSE